MNKSDAQLGLKVRDKQDLSMKGAIVSLTARQGNNFVVVEWGDDGGNFTSVDAAEIEIVPERNLDLEQEFLNLVDTIGEQIKAYVDVAEQAIQSAIQLADQHGIPFYAPVSRLGQPYVPNTFINKWSDLDREFVANLTEVNSYDLGQAYGWSHSSIC